MLSVNAFRRTTHSKGPSGYCKRGSGDELYLPKLEKGYKEFEKTKTGQNILAILNALKASKGIINK